MEGQENFSENKVFLQLQDIEYQNPNIIIILNTLAFIVLIYFLALVAFILVSVFIFFTNGDYGGEKIQAKLKKYLFFNELINLYTGATFEFLVSAWLTVNYQDFSTFGEVLSQILAFFTFGVMCPLIFVGMAYILYVDQD